VTFPNEIHSPGIDGTTLAENFTPFAVHLYELDRQYPPFSLPSTASPPRVPLALWELWGGFGVPISRLSTGFEVALMWLWVAWDSLGWCYWFAFHSVGLVNTPQSGEAYDVNN
jgi:hypothetical protein